MNKSYLIILLAVLLSSCSTGGIVKDEEIRASAIPGEFNAGDFIPLNGNLNLAISFDLDNDEVSEKALYYSDFETVPETDLTYNQEHIEIYKLKENGWVKEFNYVYPETVSLDDYNKDEQGVIYIREDSIPNIPQGVLDVSGVDIAFDGREELLVVQASDNGDFSRVNEYFILGEVSGEVKKYNIPETREKIPIGIYAHRLEVEVLDGKIIEHWGIVCEGGVRPCKYFDFELNFDPITSNWRVSNAMNIRQDEEIYNEYVEYLKQYNEEPLPWDGRLPF
ncbi:hypothetical protein GF354_05970 [Candidatus Peregrinibacteria bacterium]|nr:hypothetical protein [Candidatus Peregrinibacteria bacterium]